jgi:tRNA dimethylallyltransferase
VTSPVRAAGPDGTVGVLVGPTASGKTAIAIDTARRLGDVEIVSADSMLVYRGMDVGTAKPPAAEQSGVPHHLLDLVDPDEEFTVAAWQQRANATLDDIARRGRRALVVGGTGLYVRALVDRLAIPGQYPAVRADLDAEPDTAALHARLAALDPVAASRMEATNRRRVVRALEVTLGAGQPFSSFGPGLEAYPEVSWPMVGLEVSRDDLDARVAARYADQMKAGFLEEVRALRARPAGLSRTASQALGYRELLAHLDGGCTLDEALDEAITRTRRFARRQQRWFRRDPRIRWIDVAHVAPAAPGADQPSGVPDGLVAAVMGELGW